LVAHSQALYGRRAYLSKAAGDPLRRSVARLREKHGIADRRTIRLEPLHDVEPLQLQMLDAAAISATSAASDAATVAKGDDLANVPPVSRGSPI